MSLMARIMAAKLKAAQRPAPAAPSPCPAVRLGPELELVPGLAMPALLGVPVQTSAHPGGPRGACKAISADTGRQCCLLAGHATPHRHGRTDFVRVAAVGQQSFARRDALDGVATARLSSPFTTNQGVDR